MDKPTKDNEVYARLTIDLSQFSDEISAIRFIEQTLSHIKIMLRKETEKYFKEKK